MCFKPLKISLVFRTTSLWICRADNQLLAESSSLQETLAEKMSVLSIFIYGSTYTRNKNLLIKLSPPEPGYGSFNKSNQGWSAMWWCVWCSPRAPQDTAQPHRLPLTACFDMCFHWQPVQKVLTQRTLRRIPAEFPCACSFAYGHFQVDKGQVCPDWN